MIDIDYKLGMLRRGRPRASIDGPIDNELPVFLQYVGVYLTRRSGVALEAAALEVATLVASSSGADCFRELVRDGAMGEVESLSPEVTLPALRALSYSSQKSMLGAAGAAIAILNESLTRFAPRRRKRINRAEA